MVVCGSRMKERNDRSSIPVSVVTSVVFLIRVSAISMELVHIIREICSLSMADILVSLCSVSGRRAKITHDV
jgi:hypothetical protein